MAESHPELLAHEKEGELLRALAEFPRVVKAAAELREPHRVARYLEELAGTYHRFYDSCRVLPRGDEETARPPPGPADAGRRDPGGARQRPGPARGLRSRADVIGVPTSHPSGWAHADGALRGGPHWLREPSDPNALVAQLWSRTATKSDGVLSVGGVPLPELVREHGSPAYVLDEADFRARARAFRDAFAAYDVFYAGKAFLCTTVVRWLAEDGLSLDVCSGGELLVAERAGFPMERIGFHGNNKTPRASSSAPSSSASAGSSSTPSTRSSGWPRSPPSSAARTGVMVRVTAGVEAHTHEYIATAHEDQKFGFSIASGDALEAVRRVHDAPGLRLLGLHSHIGSQIFDTSGFEVAARRVLALHATVSEEVGVEMPEMDLGGGFGIAYTTQDDPSDPAQLATEMTQDRRARVPRARHRRAAALDRARPRDRRARRCARSTRSARSRRSPSTAAPGRTYVSVDGGMSDNIRTALYDADYSATLASRASAAPRRPGPRRRQALRGRRHRGQGRVPARRRTSRRPRRGARDGRLLQIHGLQLQPRAASSGDRSSGREDFHRAATRD